jgi:hypothetical protein
MEKLYISKKPGESPATRRRRIASCITDLLESDKLIREEVAMQLAVAGDILDWRTRTNSTKNAGLTAPDQALEEC